MKKRIKRLLSFFLVLVMLIGVMPASVLASETDTESVNVTLTVTKGTGLYELPEDTSYAGETIVQKKLTVPYFDLALYGLEKYYYNPDCYTGDIQQAGTQATADGIVTAMHVFIYATELYMLGLSEEEAGTGKTTAEELSEYISWTGGAGSSFMDLWDHGTNLNYYLDYEYPLGEEGWGSTSDQQAIEDGTAINIHMVEDSSVYGSNFSYLEVNGVKDSATVTKGDSIVMTLHHTAADWTNYTTGYETGPDEKIYSTNAAVPGGDVSKWTESGTTDENGTITIDTSNLEPGVYYYGSKGFVDVDAGTETESAVFKLTVKSDVVEDIAVTGISLDQNKIELEVNETAALTATVTPEDATDKTVTWASSDENIATVENGEVTAVAAGKATITAAAGDYSANCVVTVTEPGVVITPTTINTSDTNSRGRISSITINGVNVDSYTWTDSTTLYVDVAAGFESATVETTWNKTGTFSDMISIVGDTSVTLEDGIGMLNITAQSSWTSVIPTKKYVVKFAANGFPVEKVELNKSSLILDQGASETLTATILPVVATGTVTWSTSDETLVTVDQNGLVTAVGEGTATITATAGDVSASCLVASGIEVENKVEINQAAGNGSLNYVEFTDTTDTTVIGMTAELDGTTINVTLPHSYNPQGQVKAAFNRTADDSDLPFLSPVNSFSGVSSQQSWGRRTDVYTTTLKDGTGTQNVYLFSENNRNALAATYKLVYTTANESPVLAEGVESTAAAAVTAGKYYTVDVASLFTESEGDKLSYQVKINDGNYTDIILNEGKYSYTNDLPGEVVLTFRAYDGYGYSEEVYVVTLTFENSSITYDVTVKVPEGVAPEFTYTTGFERSIDVPGGALTAEAEGNVYTVKVPENISRISWRADGIGMSAEVSTENNTLTLQKTAFVTKTVTGETAQAAVSVSYGEYKAVGDENVFLLASGDGYTYTAVPSAEGWSTSTVNDWTVTEDTTAEITVVFEIKNAKSITADKDADVSVYYQSGYYVVQELEPVVTTMNDDGTVTYTYSCYKSSGYTYRVTKENKVTKAGYLNSVNNVAISWAEDDNRTPDYRGTYDTAETFGSRGDDSVLVNVNSQNHLILNVGDTFRLRSSRIWEIIDSDTTNVMIEPDYHYTNYDENIISLGSANEALAAAGKNQVTGNGGDNWVDITANAAGVTFLEVTYDALDIVSGYSAGSWGGAYGQPSNFTYNAIDSARTALVVIQTDGKAATDVDFGIDCYSSNVDGDYYKEEKAVAWDAEFDTLYFLEDHGTMTLSPTVADGSITEVAVSSDKGATWSVLTAEDGVYTANIYSGNNIIRVTKEDGTTAYQIVRGDKITVTIENITNPDESIKAGDKVRVTFNGLHNPVGKMSGIYNPGFSVGQRITYSYNGEDVRQSGYYQYNFVTNAWIEVTVPETGGVLEGGYINFNVFGDAPGNHRNMTDNGRGVSTSAGSSKYTRCILPDIEIAAVTAEIDYDYYVENDEVTVEVKAYNGSFNTALYALNYDADTMLYRSNALNEELVELEFDADLNSGTIIRKAYAVPDTTITAGAEGVVIDTLTFKMLETGKPEIGFVSVTAGTDDINGAALYFAGDEVLISEPSVIYSYAKSTDITAAADVEALIDAIETAEDKQEAAISARQAYDALTDNQKAIVANYSKLESAENEFAAAKVDALIEAIGTVDANSDGVIESARAAYDALTEEQKTLVTKLDILLAAETSYELWSKGDLNFDGKVSAIDVSMILSAYGTDDTDSDLDKDGTVNVQDLSILLANYGAKNS